MLKVPHVTSYLTEHFGDDAFVTLEGYRARGGYEAARKALLEVFQLAGEDSELVDSARRRLAMLLF